MPFCLISVSKLCAEYYIYTCNMHMWLFLESPLKHYGRIKVYILFMIYIAWISFVS